MNTKVDTVHRRTSREEKFYAAGTLWRIALLIAVILLSIFWGQQSHAQATWTQCAPENGSCTLTSQKLVRYGQPWVPAPNGSWTATRTIVGTFPCTSAYFGGDPSPGTGKRCETMDVHVTAPPPPLPTPGSTVRVVSWTNPATNTDGTPVCTITGTKVQASLQSDFAAWLQWDSVGPGTNIRITTVPDNVVLYWRAATICDTQASDWSTPTVRTEAEYALSNLPPCAPFPIDPIDKATPIFTTLRGKGGAYVHFCKLPDGRWKDYGKWGVYPPGCIKQAFDATQLSDAASLKEGLKQAWLCATNSPKDADDASFKPLYDELVALNRPVPALPPPPQYVVALNGIYPSRPVRAIINGVMSTTSLPSGFRVAVGAPCNCSAFKSGSWCAVTGNENVATAITDQLPASAASCSIRP